MSELIVLCRRPPPAPPAGWPCVIDNIKLALQSPKEWLAESTKFLEQPAVQVVGAHRVGVIVESRLSRLCCALADAGAGVVIERVPVRLPPMYRVHHVGTPVALEWAAIDSYIAEEVRVAAAAYAEERARKQAAWARQMETETDKHVLFTELLRLMQANRCSSDSIDAIEKESWIERVTVEELRRLIDAQREVADKR